MHTYICAVVTIPQVLAALVYGSKSRWSHRVQILWKNTSAKALDESRAIIPTNSQQRESNLTIEGTMSATWTITVGETY